MKQHFILFFILCALQACSAPQKKKNTITLDPKQLAQDAVADLGYRIDLAHFVDFDGDGIEDIIAACQSDDAVYICLFHEEKGRAVLAEKSSAIEGRSIRAFEFVRFLAEYDAKQLIVEVFAQTPDENVRHVRVFNYDNGLVEIFAHRIFETQDESPTEQNIISYRPDAKDWRYADLNDDGVHELILHKYYQQLELPSPENEPLFVRTGAYERIFRAADGRSLVEVEENHFENFLPRYDIATATASSGFDPLESGDENTVKNEDATQEDYRRYAALAIDQNLNSAWIESVQGSGQGEYINLHLAGQQEVHMIRIVPGCLESAQAFKQYNEPNAFEISIGNSLAIAKVTRPKDIFSPVAGILTLPVQERSYGKQYLIFLDGPISSDNVRVQIEGVRRGNKGNHSCIAEISVH